LKKVNSSWKKNLYLCTYFYKGGVSLKRVVFAILLLMIVLLGMYYATGPGG